MNRHPLLAILLLALTLTAGTLLLAAAAPAADVYAALASFVGGTWRADLPNPNVPGEIHLDLRYAWAPNHQGIRFDSEWVKGEKHQAYVSGMYVWNPALKKIVMTYTDAGGSLTQGPASIAGDVLTMDLKEVDGSGAATAVRVIETKEGADQFINEISILKEGSAIPVAKVVYRRVAGTAP